jgi:DNA-binding transcriptional LysR family regulator
MYKELVKVFLPTYELSNHWIIEEYVKLGLGIGIVVKDLVQDKLDSGEYVEIKTDKLLPVRETGYAYRKNALNYNIIKEFINVMK